MRKVLIASTILIFAILLFALIARAEPPLEDKNLVGQGICELQGEPRACATFLKEGEENTVYVAFANPEGTEIVMVVKKVYKLVSEETIWTKNQADIKAWLKTYYAAVPDICDGSRKECPDQW